MPIVPNPLDAELKEEEKTVPYSEDEIKYCGYLQSRLESARTLRNQNHDEFDGMSYTMYYQANNMRANSYIMPKKNREDVSFTTGTTRQALFAYLGTMYGLNLDAEVKCFGRDNNQQIQVGQSIEDAIFQANELDHDDEKKILRQYELFVQGTVFVQDNWIERYRTEKTGFDAKKWDGKLSSASWNTKLTKVYAGPCREVIPGINVYLGRITEFHTSNQPYIFTVDFKTYDEAKSIYGEWERWKYVTKKVRYWSKEVPQTLYNNNWRLENTQENVVEEVIYRDKWSNEYMIILNGVLMMPIGFPLPWDHDGYDIEGQVYEIINPSFAYGGSMVKRMKVAQDLEDEFWRLMILKTQKSFQPPRGNTSGQVLTGKIFWPAKITPGLTPDMVPKLDGVGDLGPTNSEVQMLDKLKQNLKDNSIPNLNQNPAEGGNQSATEIMQLKQQADTLMAMAVFSCSMLEKKLTALRLPIILEHQFDPIDQVADVAKMKISDMFSSISRNMNIPGKGNGRRITKLSKSIPSSKDIAMEEKKQSKSEGQPVKINYLNPDALKQTKLTWYYEINPREKDSSERSRTIFSQMMNDATKFFMNDLNLQYFEERFSDAWSLNPDKAFVKQSQQQMGMGGQPLPGQPSASPQGSPPQQTQQPKVNQLMNKSNVQVPAQPMGVR